MTVPKTVGDSLREVFFINWFISIITISRFLSISVDLAHNAFEVSGIAFIDHNNFYANILLAMALSL